MNGRASADLVVETRDPVHVCRTCLLFGALDSWQLSRWMGKQMPPKSSKHLSKASGASLAAEDGKDFQYPAFYQLPPFFTLQPHASVRAKQLELWKQLISEPLGIISSAHFRSVFRALSMAFRASDASRRRKSETLSIRGAGPLRLCEGGDRRWVLQASRRLLFKQPLSSDTSGRQRFVGLLENHACLWKPYLKTDREE